MIRKYIHGSFETTYRMLLIDMLQLTVWFALQDYYHELICITEREKFLVPVRATGARAILDFPDEINFGSAPVKVRTPLPLIK